MSEREDELSGAIPDRPGAGVKLAEIDASFKDRHESQEAAPGDRAVPQAAL